MTRIIAGRFGGRRIEAPRGDSTRPTSDRVREAIFSRLDHLDVLDGGHVVDLYAGSGALGLEAVSRGARSALLVESHKGAAGVARANAAALGARTVRVVQQAVEKAVAAPATQAAEVVLLDPPYDVPSPALDAVLADLVTNGWLVPYGVVVLERSSRSVRPVWPAGLEPIAEKVYGETVVHYAEHVPSSAEQSAEQSAGQSAGQQGPGE